ncbi:MAG: GtrA family protein [Proteobacteria bacterium]|nr:GtrA family protein [Pseudomonadota bacterium]
MPLTESLKQLLNYGVTGILTNVSWYAIYLLITSYGTEPKLAMTFIYVCGIATSYFANRKWTFKHTGHWSNSMIRYVIAHVMGYTLNFLILLVFVDYYHYPHQWVQGIAIFLVAGFLFIILKFFVFNQN